MFLKEVYSHEAVAVDDPSNVKREKEESLEERDQGGLEGNNSRGAEWTFLKIVREKPEKKSWLIRKQFLDEVDEGQPWASEEHADLPVGLCVRNIK